MKLLSNIILCLSIWEGNNGPMNCLWIWNKGAVWDWILNPEWGGVWGVLRILKEAGPDGDRTWCFSNFKTKVFSYEKLNFRSFFIGSCSFHAAQSVIYSVKPLHQTSDVYIISQRWPEHWVWKIELLKSRQKIPYQKIFNHSIKIKSQYF